MYDYTMETKPQSTLVHAFVSFYLLFSAALLCGSQSQSRAENELCMSLDGQRSYPCTSTQCLACFVPLHTGSTNSYIINRTRVQIGAHPANCTYDTDTSTLQCIPDTSTCTVQECGPCEHCVALYSKPPREPLTGEWQFTSHCIHLETHTESPDCEANGLLYPDRCVGTHRINSYEREEVLSGRAVLHGVDCGCYETNCTAGMAEIKFDFVQLPVTTTDASPGLTTSLVDQSLRPTSNLVVNVIIAVLAIVAVVMIAALVVILAFILNQRRKDRRKLHDVPHTVTSQLQNLDNPGGRESDVQHSSEELQHEYSLPNEDCILEI